MTNIKRVYSKLPEEIKNVLFISEGWLVGGSIRDILIHEAHPKDYDILVPSRELFQVVCSTLKQYPIKINTFGGLKVQLPYAELDIWIEELSHFITTATVFDYAYNLRRNKLIKNNEQI